MNIQRNQKLFKTKGETNMKYIHKVYGEVKVTDQCKALNRQFAKRGIKNESMFVEVNGEVKEVSKDFVRTEP